MSRVDTFGQQLCAPVRHVQPMPGIALGVEHVGVLLQAPHLRKAIGRDANLAAPLEPRLSGKVLPAGSYIIATEPLSEDVANQLIPQNLALCDQKVGLDYYRLSADRRLLFGGACHYSGR